MGALWTEPDGLLLGRRRMGTDIHLDTGVVTSVKVV